MDLNASATDDECTCHKSHGSAAARRELRVGVEARTRRRRWLRRIALAATLANPIVERVIRTSTRSAARRRKDPCDATIVQADSRNSGVQERILT